VLSTVYKTLFSLTNLYRMLRGPMLKSTYCAGDQSDRRNCEQEIDLTAYRGAPMKREKSILTFAKSILAALTTSGLLALGTQAASAQKINVTTPFGFSAGNEFYPAGTYQFTVLSEWSLSIRNVNGKGEKFFAVRPEESGPLGSRGGLIFRNFEGHRTLQAVYVPGADRAAELCQHETVSHKAKREVGSTTMSATKVAAVKQSATIQ
jgi:hypothetical protein